MNCFLSSDFELQNCFYFQSIAITNLFPSPHSSYWSVIDRLRKMTGKLIRWKPDDSSNLKELWNKVVLPLSKSQTENQADSKQIFYTCLQIFVQASGAYTELVEPALITGNDDKKSSLVLRTSFYVYANYHRQHRSLFVHARSVPRNIRAFYYFFVCIFPMFYFFSVFFLFSLYFSR